MKTEFNNIRLNDDHQYDANVCGNKSTVKIYKGDTLIAKKISIKNSIRFFGCKNYKDYITSKESENE